ncbi:hypothetical protein I7I51_05298, partial [Histoplasma capsulatum]
MQPITAHYPTRQTGSAFTRQAPPSTAKPTSRRRHTEPKKRFSVTNQPQQIRLPSNTGPLQPSTIQYTPIQTRLSTTDRAFDHSSIRYWPVGGGGSGLVSAFLTPLRRLRQSDPAGGGGGEARCRQWPFIRQVLLCNPRTWTSSSRPHLEQLGEQGRRPKANLSPRPVGNRVIQQIWVLVFNSRGGQKRYSIYLSIKPALRASTFL